MSYTYTNVEIVSKYMYNQHCMVGGGLYMCILECFLLVVFSVSYMHLCSSSFIALLNKALNLVKEKV